MLDMMRSSELSEPNLLPLWEDLPAFKIYLDQLLDLSKHYIEPITGDKLTKTMMHNYTKASIIVKPVDKRYQRIQLAGAIVVSLLKPIFSLDQIKAGLMLELHNDSPKIAYNRFAKLYNELIVAVANNQDLLPTANLASDAALIQYQAILAVIFRSQSLKILVSHQANQVKPS